MFDIDYILEIKQKLQKNEQNETKNIDNDFIYCYTYTIKDNWKKGKGYGIRSFLWQKPGVLLRSG